MEDNSTTFGPENRPKPEQESKPLTPQRRRSMGLAVFTALVLISGIFYTYFYFRFIWPVAVATLRQLQIYALPIYTAVALLHILFSLTSGLGLLFRKEWARRLYLVYSIYVLCIGNIFYILMLTSPVLRKILVVIMSLPQKTFSPIRDLTIFSSVIPFIPLAVFSLWFLTRPQVKQQFIDQIPEQSEG